MLRKPKYHLHHTLRSGYENCKEVLLHLVSPDSHRLGICEYNNNKNHIPEFKYTLVILIRCPECGANTDLAAAYYNVEDAEVRCSGCKAKLTVTLKNGEIKKIETKGPGIG
jgi:ssDNA-binding Zn-finger/Zn-ribbon topoisomerase 1